jgi:hypothetical protein
MESSPALFAAAAFALLADPQVEAQFLPPVPGGASHRGEAEGVDLDSVVTSPALYQRAYVRTRGRLQLFPAHGYYILADGHARILVLLGHHLVPNEIDRFLGLPVEAKGVVRRIRPKEYIGGRDLDLIEDPDLPVLPAPHVSLPQVSLTLLGIADMTPFVRTSQPQAEPAHRILADPLAYRGRSVVVMGRFCGRSLCGGLPPDSRRRDADWVLDDGSAAVWITGRAPRGKGFSLDLFYEPDTTRWLMVTGKPEVDGGILYLRASKVELTTAPPQTPER